MLITLPARARGGGQGLFPVSRGRSGFVFNTISVRLECNKHIGLTLDNVPQGPGASLPPGTGPQGPVCHQEEEEEEEIFAC
jgi:hypothetical protein